jgi:xanthine dehydrogenase accessory factor
MHRSPTPLVALGERLGYEIAPWTGDACGRRAAVVAAAWTGRRGGTHGRLRAGRGLRRPVASRKRGEAVVATLDVCGSMKALVRTPAGIDIGARTPEEVALSILADIVASRPRPSGRAIGEAPHVTPETAIDPVCKMTVAMVDTSLHLDHEGTRWWFCGSGCLRAFAATPDAYRW